MHALITALREMRGVLAGLATAVLVFQMLLTGVAGGTAAAHGAVFGAGAAVICHGSGDQGPAPAQNVHDDCCVSCSAQGAAVPVIDPLLLDRLRPQQSGLVTSDGDAVGPTRRAIRAGPSQAPPVC